MAHATCTCCAPLPSQRLCTPCVPATAPTTQKYALLTPHAVSSTGARKVVARGMRRFEARLGALPEQPDVERLSPRVLCVLGMNPSPYTLNGTCCYLVGTGPERILIDAGGWPGGDEAEAEFISHLAEILATERVTSLNAVVVTHLHTDHFGGCRALQGILGAPVPVAMLAPPPSQLSLYTIRELRARGLFNAVRAGPPPLFTGPSTFGFGGVPLPAWPNEDLSWDRARRSKRQIQADFFYALQQWDFIEAWCDPGNTSIPGMELHDGDVLRVAGATLRVVATPGHAQNHCALWLDEEVSALSFFCLRQCHLSSLFFSWCCSFCCSFCFFDPHPSTIRRGGITVFWRSRARVRLACLYISAASSWYLPVDRALRRGCVVCWRCQLSAAPSLPLR